MLILTQADLEYFCADLKDKPFIAVDTEFVRERTYYPRLCLIQIAGPDGKAAAIDPLSDNIDLEPVLDLFSDEKIVKVFHAARQDLEIFHALNGQIPLPFFDTQIAAMVCGHGEQVGYATLVQSICGHQIDKGQQYTDWSRRPLSGKQLSYALEDVIWLVDIYKHLTAELEQTSRAEWIIEETRSLTDPSAYEVNPDKAWRRVKIRNTRPRTLAILKELAAWREKEAMRRDVPRGRVLKDDALSALALQTPKTAENLKNVPGISSATAEGAYGRNILNAISRGKALPEKECPALPRRQSFPLKAVAVLEMLKTLLRMQAAEYNLVPRLICSNSDLERLATEDEPDIPALKGWRYEIFGEEALAMKTGKIALRLNNKTIEKFEPQDRH